MIVFDLECRAHGHRFEGWFGSSADFASQQERGLLACPECGSVDVIKAPMAAKLARKGNQAPVVSTSAGLLPASGPQPMSSGAMTPEAVKLMHALHAMQTEALKQSRWVGEGFAEKSRAMHYGESEVETIHGQATIEEARALHEEGIQVMPLPFPVAPPGETN